MIAFVGMTICLRIDLWIQRLISKKKQNLKLFVAIRDIFWTLESHARKMIQQAFNYISLSYLIVLYFQNVKNFLSTLRSVTYGPLYDWYLNLYTSFWFKCNFWCRVQVIKTNTIFIDLKLFASVFTIISRLRSKYNFWTSSGTKRFLDINALNNRKDAMEKSWLA